MRRGGGHRRIGAVGLRRAGRLRELLVAGVTDSFGMALGWTVLVLFAVSRGGLAEAALYNAAMLLGVVLSAPVTGWLSRRFPGRGLLRGAAGTELLLRVGALAGLLAGLPSALIAAAVVVMNIAAWTGFAAMRAEVAAVDAGPRAMTRYALAIAAVEAAGTGVAALLPVDLNGHLLLAVYVVYGGSLIPTLLSARRARMTPLGAARRVIPGRTLGYGAISPVVAAPRIVTDRAFDRAFFGRAYFDRRRRLAVSPRVLAAGGGVMLLAAGPTLLAVPLTTELHGRHLVALTAVAFSIGCLLATAAVSFLSRSNLPPALRWTLWGLVMLIGWLGAPLHASAVIAAQFLAGLSQTAFEGDMDALIASEAPADGVTTALAYSASVRALGGSIAVKLLPTLVAAPQIDHAVSAAVLILALAALTLWAATTMPWIRRAEAPV
ncbi:hypothetical protein [Actinoplanes sp. RD1]|uniref:hypothetical protein n=1 Tax=Actinoplanes sp. RD1 TaxID=3064538 RepID=UPI002741186F|nr:hypothetical protein [Actinoplanes sp. RD1]